jgi:hypothetical protein
MASTSLQLWSASPGHTKYYLGTTNIYRYHIIWDTMGKILNGLSYLNITVILQGTKL